MNKHIQEKVEDGKSIVKTRAENAVIIAGFPAVDEDIDAIEEIIVEIDSRSPDQTMDNTGIAEDKETAAIALAEEIDKHAQLAGSYLMKMGDMTNYNKIKNYKLYKLKRMKPAELKIAAATIIKICTDFLTQLLPYKVTALTIAKITAANTAYEPLSNEPKETREKKKISTTSIIDLSKQLTFVINYQLRGSLIALKEPQPDLYYLLYNFTFDDKLGAHSHFPISVVTGHVIIKAINSVTGEPIEGVSFRAVGFPQVSVTDNLGMAIIELPLGTQVLKMICFDYQANEITVEVSEEDLHTTVTMTLAV